MVRFQSSALRSFNANNPRHSEATLMAAFSAAASPHRNVRYDALAEHGRWLIRHTCAFLHVRAGRVLGRRTTGTTNRRGVSRG